MLKEISNLSDTSSDLNRRWFSDTELDLYVWYDTKNHIIEFQLCYNKGNDEQALVWNRDTGLAHHTVNSGVTGPDKMKESPIMTEDATYNISKARTLFTEAGQKLEHDLFDFILNCLDKA